MWIARGGCGWTLRCGYEIPRVRPTVVERGSPAFSANSEGEKHTRLSNGSSVLTYVRHNILAPTEKQPSSSFTVWNIPVVCVAAILC
jgi:hypothetical protein